MTLRRDNLLAKFCFVILLAAMCCGRVAASGVFFPGQVQPGLARLTAGGADSVVTLSNDLFSASFINDGGRLRFGGCPAMGLLPGTELFSVTPAGGMTVPASEMTVKSWLAGALEPDSAATVFSERLPGKWVGAVLRHDDMTIEWRAVLRDGSHYLRTELTLTADGADVAMPDVAAMIYEIPATGAPEVVGNTRGAVLASEKIFAGLETPTGINTVELPSRNSPEARMMQGLWRRHATLAKGHSMSVSAVVGLIAAGQPRRSFLAYSERERAVPWRPFPIYNSWYELNIDRNNSPDYSGHMTSADCRKVVETWTENLSVRHGEGVKAFVWDDGWDSYGTWTFNPGFPDGFREPLEAAANTGAGTGVWLGPVGGYGASGEMRRAYWAGKGGMHLSNPLYYDVFMDACRTMINDYDMCFFKLDGISAQYSAVGPDPGPEGDENAERIIDAIREVRGMRPDIFLNTTVGTWASPFWFHFTDAVWRQESDFALAGDRGDDRERWITYRDRLVYRNFVKASPLCPINTLMTHGVILSEHGDVSKTMDYDGIVRELRCAVACGSGLVELYCDSKLLDSINGGALWGDIAECIRWQRENADVLPDIHWVGGNPWDGTTTRVYGWASWNGRKATLALRNADTEPRSFTFTLRDLLEIPPHDNPRVKLTKSFASQSGVEGLDTSASPEGFDVDREINVVLPPTSVFVFDGLRSPQKEEER